MIHHIPPEAYDDIYFLLICAPPAEPQELW